MNIRAWIGRESRPADIYALAWHGEEVERAADHRAAERRRFFMVPTRRLPAGRHGIGLKKFAMLSEGRGLRSARGDHPRSLVTAPAAPPPAHRLHLAIPALRPTASDQAQARVAPPSLPRAGTGRAARGPEAAGFLSCRGSSEFVRLGRRVTGIARPNHLIMSLIRGQHGICEGLNGATKGQEGDRFLR